MKLKLRRNYEQGTVVPEKLETNKNLVTDNQQQVVTTENKPISTQGKIQRDHIFVQTVLRVNDLLDMQDEVIKDNVEDFGIDRMIEDEFNKVRGGDRNVSGTVDMDSIPSQQSSNSAKEHKVELPQLGTRNRKRHTDLAPGFSSNDFSAQATREDGFNYQSINKSIVKPKVSLEMNKLEKSPYQLEKQKALERYEEN